MLLNILAVIEQNSWVEFHIIDSLKTMGHQVQCFYIGDYVGEFYGRSRKDEQLKKNIDLLSQAKQLRDLQSLDLIFCYVYDDFLLEEYAKKLAQLGVPMVNYNVDMPTKWYRAIKTSRYFDCMLCAQPQHMKSLSKYSRKVHYFPMAAPVITSEENHSNIISIADLTFLGTSLPFRQRLLNALAQEEWTLEVYGKYWNEIEPDTIIRSKEKALSDMISYAWPRLKYERSNFVRKIFSERIFPKNHATQSHLPSNVLKGPIKNEEITSLLRCSKINLGITRYEGDSLLKKGSCKMKLRDFEVPMAGGFYLVEQSPGYENAFIDGKEVVTWETLPDLKEKISYFLQHDKEREEIARAGQVRAEREHSWQSRFVELFNELDLNGP